MRIWLAIRVFFLVLFDGLTAQKVQAALSDATENEAAASPAKPPKPTPAVPAPSKPKAAAPARSEAITLLATLQREARLVDFLQEKLDDYSDDQIGAAVRDVQRDSAAVLERLFALQPLSKETEGAELEIPTGFDAARFQLVGNLTGQPPFKGHLVHHGWLATRCELPVWSGSESAAKIVAPTEVELK